MQPHAWWRATAISLLVLALGLAFGTRVLVGPPGATVHVRWQPGTVQAERQRLERQFHLTASERLDDRTWRYNLTDPSRENIRTIVTSPAVDDTHDIDRRSYSVASSATRTARPERFTVNGDAAVRTADGVALVTATIAGILFLLGMSGQAQTPGAARQALGTHLRNLSQITQATVAPASRFVSRGIPVIDAHTAGVFRIVFGIAAVLFVASHQESAASLNAAFNPLIEGELHASVLQWLRAHPYIVDGLTPWLLATGVAFTAGAWTRFTYPLFVAGVLVWLFVAITHDSTHPHSTLALTLVALLPSRWGDALSIDSWRRRENSQTESRTAAKRYGYSVWVPGLVVGVAFAAAAWAKLSRTPGWADWIVNGSVKYHFIADAHNAPVDWGLLLAGYPWLAVLASLGAVLVEALAITAAFSRSQRYRLAVGAAALSLLAGFWLFMGVFWAGWWILLLGFLPWQHLVRFNHAPARMHYQGSATTAQAVLIVAIVAQQVVVSGLAIERAPMFTHYPMYSATYASPAQFNASRIPYYRIVVSTAEGKVELPCNAPEDLVEEFRAALAGSADAAADVWRSIRGCSETLDRVRDVTLEGDRSTFDWDRLTLTTRRAAIVLGPLAADAR